MATETREERIRLWRELVGESDSGSEADFLGFELEETKAESDVDLNIIVNNEEVLRELERNGDSSDTNSENGDAGDSVNNNDNGDLPTIAPPRKRNRLSKKKRDELTTHFSSQVSPIDHEKVNKTFEDHVKEGTVNVGVSHGLPADAMPYEYFSLFITEDMWELFADEPNKYADQKQQEKGVNDKLWKKATVDDMKIYIYIQFMFGIHKLPEADNYWSTDPLLRVEAVAGVMAKLRYQKLSQYFHLNDNEKAKKRGEEGFDALFKVRPLMDTVAVNSRLYYHPGQNISVDEAMIKFNGRLSFKQYVKGKPNPWGVKVWCSADPRTGYMLDFDVYLGRSAEPLSHGLGYHVVMKLVDRFLDQGRHIYYDNFFSSVKLAQDLEKRDTFMASTIRLNRKGWPTDINAAKAKKMKAGEVEFRQDGSMVATMWKDKRSVAVLSTNSNAGMTTVERKAVGGKKNVTIPTPIVAYNTNMGGVDLADQHASYYTVGRPSIRWWRYICWWMLQTAMVNSFLLYKASQPVVNGKPTGMRHLDFRLGVLRSLMQGKKTARKRAAPERTSLAGVTCTDPLTHVVERIPGRKKNCKECEKAKRRTLKGRGVNTVFGCLVCRVHLCKAPCFTIFHEKLAQAVSNHAAVK